MQILIINDEKIKKQISYLTTLNVHNIIQEEIKKEGIEALEWLLALSNNFYRGGRYIKRDSLVKEINWLEAEVARNDIFGALNISAKLYSKQTQLEWALEYTSEPLCEGERSKPEIFQKNIYAEYPDFLN